MSEIAELTPSELPTSLIGKLSRGRMELLDLSTRNRLIHVPRRSKSAKTVEAIDELTAEVYRLLVTEGRTLTFAPGRRAPGEAEREPDGAAPDEHEMTELAQPEDGEVDERGVAQRHSDTKLQTRLTSEGLQKRLLTLHLDAKTLQEEQGVNILFLAMGMLKWFEDTNSDTERFAPLILVPVVLERGNAAERFRLRWLQEDPSPNLSLAALLRRQFGLELPAFVEGDQEAFGTEEYLSRIEKAVSGQPRWEVLKNDIVLGFFSFAKFLMYRDLDPANWPQGSGLADHPVISGLLGDGFPSGEPLFGDDDPIDPHIGPEALVHIVDADSSQTAAVHEVRRGRHLIIQGPPGTGKSQTIANIIASAVVDGRRVLFVAEKMAALEVVKRRLDQTGVGDVCLELHSNKANKRAVLDELRRTWDLGRPNGSADGTLIRQLGQYRDRLNDHAARLHRRREPSGLSAYHAIGHLIRLRQAGQQPATTCLDGPELWSRHDKAERELQLKELAGRIDDIGAPSAHPWRGVGLPSILPTELQRLVARVTELRGRVSNLLADRDALGAALGGRGEASLDGAERLARLGERVASAPDLDADALSSGCWSARAEGIADLVKSGELYGEARQELSPLLSEAAWDVDVKLARQNIASYGASWLRWLKGDYRRADALFRSILAGKPPRTLEERLRLLDRLVAAQKAAADIARDDDLGREAFGSRWRRDRSDWTVLRRALDWVRGNGDGEMSAEIRRLAAATGNRSDLGALARRVGNARPEIQEALGRLFADLKLDVSVAFGAGELGDLDLRALSARLDTWIERFEDLTKWIAYSARAEQARAAGLGALVDRLADGSLDARSVVPEFEMAYYEALLSAMAGEDPEIARFDGDGHARLVQEFGRLDKERIRLARLEVASAHHARMPRQDGGAGPLGVLKGEIARKRGHMPIRQLMKRAGAAIQAIKPVFMMSPLSVAQFLEPGAVDFDLLVIDEASQIQPIDALGAIARCKQAVVVGDDRQLPPTRFFDKVIAGTEDEEEDGAAGVADVESVLGLCVSKGLPQRMLRWHYRSRHQSLIAVSNSEFYDNRLYIVPSPYTQQAGMGLRFNHLPHGTFDSGNTAINAVEARAVAEAVIRHAREHPDLSLGVATFSSKQRRAIVDELERLRRLNPDTEGFFTTHPAEPFFVKNLENVQGDERDVILISVGYGRNPQGYMAMRFGPLSSEGGERRLNVLISRAKRRCEVFASITDEDIDLERGRGKGVAAFKLFLHFARTGKLGIGIRTDREHDSVFEEQVAAALRSHGHDVHPQVGLAGFFIDLAVADFDRPGRYVIGIECDGAAYHSSRSARDRDRLRQAVLEDHGWTIHRIWSTDWFQRPQEQLEKALAAIAAAKAELASLDERGKASSRAVPLEIVTVEREGFTEIGLQASDALSSSAAYREASFQVPSHIQIHEVPAGLMADLVRQVVEVEGPVHGSEVVARLRTLWRLQKAGNRIQAAVERGTKAACQAGVIASDEHGFLSIPGTKPIPRDRSEVSSNGLRKPEMLPPAEIEAAALAIVTANLGATPEEVVMGTSRLFGFKATSAQLRQVLTAVVDAAVRDGVLIPQGDLLTAGTART
jgi:very-short-patch-repair endonuclease/DNA polymerase III delta prime subunit